MLTKTSKNNWLQELHLRILSLSLVPNESIFRRQGQSPLSHPTNLATQVKDIIMLKVLAKDSKGGVWTA